VNITAQEIADFILYRYLNSYGTGLDSDNSGYSAKVAAVSVSFEYQLQDE
jgi:hypothetical protein